MTNDENYEKICQERFNKLEHGQSVIYEHITAIREKIYDGFDSKIDAMKFRIEWNSKLIYLILGGVILSIVVPIIKSIFWGQ